MAPQPIREDSLLTGHLEPTNDAYAIAKIAGVLQVQALRRQHGLPYISAMPTNLYGPGDTRRHTVDRSGAPCSLVPPNREPNDPLVRRAGPSLAGPANRGTVRQAPSRSASVRARLGPRAATPRPRWPLVNYRTMPRRGATGSFSRNRRQSSRGLSEAGASLFLWPRLPSSARRTASTSMRSPSWERPPPTTCPRSSSCGLVREPCGSSRSEDVRACRHGRQDLHRVHTRIGTGPSIGPRPPRRHVARGVVPAGQACRGTTRRLRPHRHGHG
jgi:NAD dependent epimerase/dehydratase family